MNKTIYDLKQEISIIRKKLILIDIGLILMIGVIALNAVLLFLLWISFWELHNEKPFDNILTFIILTTPPAVGIYHLLKKIDSKLTEKNRVLKRQLTWL